MAFVHLHTHTEWSLLDGSNKVKDYVARVKELGMNAAAITDHGVMYGVIAFYDECLKQGIKPIIGCEVYVAPGSRFDRELSTGDDRYYHLILLAENNEGYANLSKIVSHSFTEGYYYKPRVDMELLAQYHEGIIASSACLAGEIPRAILRGDHEGALAAAKRLSALFGPDHFYLELQDHMNDDNQTVVNREILAISRELGLPLVATNDCHYTRAEDAAAHDVLLCVQTGRKVTDEDRMRYPGGQFYVKSEEEMRALFPYAPEALDNTQKIADRCNVTIEFGKTKLPHFEVPEGYDSWTYLNHLCDEGFAKHYPDDDGTVRKRLDYELGVIKRMGYVDYFLIVWDYVNWARDHGIAVGPGRGSAAGSVVSFCTGITQLDPIRYDLLFERFLNPERVSMPDIDVDFEPERRQEVIDHVTELYGKDHVVQIITFGTMLARGVIRDVGRAMDLPYSFADSISKMVPNELGITLREAMKKNPELKQAYDGDERVHKLIDTSLCLEGLPRHTSVHAAGVVICSRPAEDLIPLSRAADGSITTQFQKEEVERLGLLKMDFLGLRNLTVIRNAVLFANRTLAKEKAAAKAQAGADGNTGKETQSPSGSSAQRLAAFHAHYPGLEKIRIEDVGLDDTDVYASLSTGHTEGVFQLESGGMQSFMKELRPSCFEDVIAGIALYRPGPMDFIPRYISGKKDPKDVRYAAPQLEPILKPTYGCIVYQEQVMQIVQNLGGYSLGRADLVRRAMSHKEQDVMNRERQNFVYGNETDHVPGCVANGIDEQTANGIFDTMLDFAKYAFNKSHAACYAVVTYETAWLRYYFPTEYMAALETSVIDNPGKLSGYILTSRSMGITMLPPDINRGEAGFSVTEENGKPAIRYALNAVKGVGTGVINAIVDDRNRYGAFRDLRDFIERITVLQADVNKRVVENLIKAGALDCFGYARRQMMSVYGQLMDQMAASKKNDLAGQMSLFDFAPDESRNQFAVSMPDLPEYPKEMKLAYEKEVLGVYVSGHPLEDSEALWKAHVTKHASDFMLDEETGVPAVEDSRMETVGGIITAKKIKYTKNDKVMCFLTLEDLTGSMEIIVFPRNYEEDNAILNEDAKVFIRGRVSCEDEKDAKLICSKVTLFDDVPKKVWLRFPDLPSYEAAAGDLASIIDANGGPDKVVIYVENPKSMKTLPAGQGVRADTAVLELLTRRFGRENVVCR